MIKSTKNDTAMKRLNYFIENQGDSKYKFYKKTLLSNGFLDKNRNIGSDKCEIISLHYPDLNLDWLITGKGEMLKNAYLENSITTIAKEDQHNYNTPGINKKELGVPYYDVDFIGGFDLVLNDQTINPNYYIDFPPFNDADCWVNITGKSMSPFISHGDLVALKEMNNWNDFLLYGEIYAIVTEDFRTVKILSKSDKENFIKLIPYNKSAEFVEQDLPKKYIKKIFAVKGSIKKFF